MLSKDVQSWWKVYKFFIIRSLFLIYYLLILDEELDLDNSNKFKLLLSIVEESIILGDKLLIFSQYVYVLDLMEQMLKRTKQYKRNMEYFRIDGNTDAKERCKQCDIFNDPSNSFAK